MSDENWDDDDSAPVAARNNNNNGFGTNFGKGRGFKPVNNSYDNNSSGFGTFEDSGREERRPGGRSQDFGNDSENKGFGGGSKGFGGNDDSDNRGFGGESRGFGGDSRGFGGESRGFGGESRGFGDDQGDGENRRGGRGGRGGRGRGGRGSRGGGGGDRNYNRDDNQESGFGGTRGFGDDNNNKGFGGGGFGDENDNGGGSRGFGGGGGFDNDNEGDDRSGGRGRGRGGRGGRGRGGGGDRGDRDNFNNDGGNDDKPEKPRESYVPPERSNDDETLFGSGVSAGINFSKYDNIEVKTTGIDIPDKIQTFQEANLRQLLMDNIIKSKYTVPTPIQKHAIPILMVGRDLMGCAQTGSGKTAAFLIPIVQKLLATDRNTSDMASINNVEPRALVIAPTRELAIQIFDECRKFSNGSFLKCRIVYGGTAKFHQKKQLFTGCDILVATPGRLIDLVGEGKITFNAIEFVVLDEADRMLDMGFIGDVEKVLRHDTMVPAGQRQTLMFSATFPKAIQELAGKFLVNYAFTVVGIVGAACKDVEQSFHKVKKAEKRQKLKELLENEANNNTLNGILVFVEEKKTADFIACFLSENSFPTTSIHGDRLQREREEALNDFKKGTMNILVATSVASRGLDIKNVRLVINYDLPKEIDDYVHRIGRTGRVGNKGRAVSFYDAHFDNRIQADLVKILTLADQQVPDWLSEGASGGGSGGHAKFGGEDIRSFSDVQGSQGAAQPVEEEEEW